MIKKFIVGFLFIFVCGYGYGQTSTCAQTLRLARSTYEQGRFHEIPALLENCLTSGDAKFTKQERVEALRILTLAYLYQEEPVLADETMIRLLNTNHFFEINENVDPAEFTALYRTFRTKPLFSLGLKFGANSTYSTAIKNYYVGGNSTGKGEYSPVFNIQFGVVFEKELFGGRGNSKWTAAPEILVMNQSASYANEVLTINDQSGLTYSNIENRFAQTRLDLNGLLQYKIKDININPYVMLGPGISLLTKSTSELLTSFPEEGSVVTGPSVDMTDTYNALDYTVTVGGGMKVKFGDIYVTVDARYKYGLTNLSKARNNLEATFDYGFVNNDFRQSSVIVNIGFVWPYFNPKKL